MSSCVNAFFLKLSTEMTPMTRSRAIIGTPSHDSVGFVSATALTPMRFSSATLPMSSGS